MTDPSLEDELVAGGRYLRLATAGSPAEVVIGFVERADGSMVIAGGAEAIWPRRLRETPRCRVTVGEHTFDADAAELDGAAHAVAIRDLILRYGTPAERLGSGPAFVLRPLGVEPSEARRSSR